MLRIKRFSGVPLELAIVVAAATAISATALFWCLSQGYTLYYGDAEAHLNIARRIIDSRTPGFDQIGTVWLPLPHALMLPFVAKDSWWRSGLAGGLPSAMAFVATCAMLYAAVRRTLAWPAAAVTAVAVFALNPNVLYLQSIPMTESIFFASLSGLLLTTVWFCHDGPITAVFAAAAFSNAASLTRYEGWFLAPFIAVFLTVAGGRRRWWAGVLFGALASLAPLAWFAHNWWYFRNPLEFYNGPWSAKGIYERALKAGLAKYPGDHDWGKALQYFWAAVRLNAGEPLAWMGIVGVAAALWKRTWWPVLLLGLPPIFYVWSMHGSGTPIFVPHLWPKSYYNTRYGSTMLPLFAIGAATLVALSPARFRWGVSCVVVLAAILPWVLHPHVDASICWKESQVNSDARRAWTHAGARYLEANYKAGQGVFTSFGDLTGIFRAAGIPIRETMHEGNNPDWMAASARPSLFLREDWAVSFSGEDVATAVQRANRDRPLYALVARVSVPGAKVIEIYRRSGGAGALAKLCRSGLIESCEQTDPSVEIGDDDEDPVHESPRR